MSRHYRLSVGAAIVVLVGQQLWLVDTRVVPALAATAATAATGWAGWQSSAATRNGWWRFAVAVAAWGVADAFGASTNVGHVASSVAAVMAIAALISFLGRPLSRVANARAILDAVAAGGSLLFLAWTAGLGDVWRSTGGGTGRFLSVAYPMADIAIGALLVVAGTRIRRNARLPWMLVSGGVVMVLVGDAVFAYFRLTSVGGADVHGTVWTAACLLIALGALSPGASVSLLHPEPRPGRPFVILLPYAPFVIAAARATSLHVQGYAFDGASVGIGAALVVLLLARQLLAQFENLELTRQLEAKVQERTAALERHEAHFRSLVQNASDIVTVVDGTGRITYQSPSVERILGYTPTALVEHSLDVLLHPDDAKHFGAALVKAAVPPAPPTVIDSRLKRADGSWLATETSVSNLLSNEKLRGYVLTTRDVSERRELEDQLRHRALHDPLTGLGNRTLFHDRLAHAVARGERKNQLLAVLVLDLDGFKAVNDTLGHAAGDALLVEVAARLSASVRPADTVARLGGDEFAVLLDEIEVEGPEIVANRILNRLRAPVSLGGKSIVPTGSVGVAMTRGRLMSPEEILRAADLAMYSAKTGGKSRYQVFEASMQAAVLHRVEVEADLRRALRSGELVNHYQPIVEIPSGRMAGVEALARWFHPERGMVSPGEFIPVAEETGLVVEIGRQVLRQACADAARWQAEHPSEQPFWVSVNVAARQLVYPHLVADVAEALRESGIPPWSLVLEITEGALMADSMPVLDELRALGVRLAIDDFGTGWSSLSRLRSFPVDKLKIDRAFVSEITSASADVPIVAAIVAMAKSLGLGLVAEGVETIEQLACLSGLRCEEVQGFLLSKPVSAAALDELLAAPTGLLRSPNDTGTEGFDFAVERSQTEQGFMQVVGSAVNGSGAVQGILDELRRVAGVEAAWVGEGGDVSVPVTLADGTQWGTLSVTAATRTPSLVVLLELFAGLLGMAVSDGVTVPPADVLVA